VQLIRNILIGSTQFRRYIYNPNFPVDRATALARGGIFLNDLSNKTANDEEKDVRTGKSLGTKCTP
jgi:hypothetical protein